MLINFHDITGKKIRSRTGNGKESSLNISVLNFGIYFIYVFDRKGNIERKKYLWLNWGVRQISL